MTDNVAELQQLLARIRRWWLAVLAVLLIALLLGYVITKSTKPEYETSAKLFVTTTSATSLTGSNSDSQTALMLSSSYADMIDTYRVAEAVLVTDASVLAPHVDGVIVVLDEEQTKMRGAMRTVHPLNMVGGKVLGVVVNKFNARGAGYGGYYYYHHAGYYDNAGDSGHDSGGVPVPQDVLRTTSEGARGAKQLAPKSQAQK